MQLSTRQRRALEAITDTFAPWAGEVGVADAIAGALDGVPESDRVQLGRLLSLWDSPALARGRRFSTLPRDRRERFLLSWADSRLPLRRRAFHALRRASLFYAYTRVPFPAMRNPSWEEIGYPGPLGQIRESRIAALTTHRPMERGEISCDVCVVGSGAGGGVAAAVLAKAGLSVVVLEMGRLEDEASFTGAEHAGYAGLYLQGGAAATADGAIGILAGSCVGGGTIVNYTTSFRTPDEVREEWAAHGVPAFASDDFTRSLDDVCARIGVNTDHNRPSRRDELLRRGCEALGWHVDAMPRNVIGCDQGRVCGYCGYGCPLGAKQSTMHTWLVDAQAAGALLFDVVRGDRILVEDGAAAGVEAGLLIVRSRAVVAACGAIHTPALLRRSGLRNPNVGRHLRLHPVGAVLGVFDEEVRPWEGTLQALYSDEHRNLDDGYGLKYETAPVHPSLAAVSLPWRGAEQHLELMRELPRSSVVGVLLRDRGSGEVRVGRDGAPVVRYRVSPYDRRHLERGLDGARRILEAAGARRTTAAESLFSFHQMGSARMGGSGATSACNGDGETWEVRNLVVCDGSTFPTASGVNPMVTIEAVAHLNASRLAARLA